MSTTAQLEQPPLENPYETPAQTLEASKAEPQEPPKPTFISNAIAVAGAFMFMLGYFASAFTLIDLYVPSNPMLGVLVGMQLSATMLWFVYGMTLITAVAGTLMICSRPIPVAVMVAYFMCPLLAVAYAIGSPLRLAKQWATPVAAIYLAIGVCCVAIAGPRMISYYAMRGTDESLGAMAFHMMLLAGVAFIAGAVAKLVSNSASGDFTLDQLETE